MPTFTPNKNLIIPNHNEFINTWDTSAANPDYTTIDTCFSGTLLLNATGLSGNQALTQTQVQPPFIQISGAPTAAITYTVPASIGGTWTVRNTTTVGFAVGIVSLAGGATVLIPANQQLTVVCDGSATGMLVTNSVYSSTGVHFPNGTVQATAANGMVLFGTQTVSGASTIDFTSIPATVNAIAINNLRLELDLQPSTLNMQIGLQFYNSVGVLDTSNVYSYAIFFFNGSGTSTTSVGATSSLLLNSPAGTNFGLAVSGRAWINNIQGLKATQCNWSIDYLLSDNGTLEGATGIGNRSVNGPITGVRVMNIGGTFTGLATLYAGP